MSSNFYQITNFLNMLFSFLFYSFSFTGNFSFDYSDRFILSKDKELGKFTLRLFTQNIGFC